MSKDTTAATVEVRKSGELLACVRHNEGAGNSLEVGPSFGESMRVWFDRMNEHGDLLRDDRVVGVVRPELRTPVRKAVEAAMWEANTGDVSALCDGQDGVSYINMEDM